MLKYCCLPGHRWWFAHRAHRWPVLDWCGWRSLLRWRLIRDQRLHKLDEQFNWQRKNLIGCMARWQRWWDILHSTTTNLRLDHPLWRQLVHLRNDCSLRHTCRTVWQGRMLPQRLWWELRLMWSKRSLCNERRQPSSRCSEKITKWSILHRREWQDGLQGQRRHDWCE